MIKCCYLLHFDRPYEHALHYVGATENLKGRLEQHLSGKGSPLIWAVLEAGIGIELTSVFRPHWETEQFLKRQNNTARYCPICCGSEESAKVPPGAIRIELETIGVIGIPLRLEPEPRRHF